MDLPVLFGYVLMLGVAVLSVLSLHRCRRASTGLRRPDEIDLDDVPAGTDVPVRACWLVGPEEAERIVLALEQLPEDG